MKRNEMKEMRRLKKRISWTNEVAYPIPKLQHLDMKFKQRKKISKHKKQNRLDVLKLSVDQNQIKRRVESENYFVTNKEQKKSVR
jgi:hypothetical protein